jgi:hypothetical protein
MHLLSGQERRKMKNYIMKWLCLPPPLQSHFKGWLFLPFWRAISGGMGVVRVFP